MYKLMLETKCWRIQSVGPKNINETAKIIVNQIFNLESNLIPFCIPLIVDIEKIVVKAITMPTFKNKESETHVNRPAALLSCKLKCIGLQNVLLCLSSHSYKLISHLLIELFRSSISSSINFFNHSLHDNEKIGIQKDF